LSKKLLIFGALGVLLLAGGGGAAYFFLFAGKKEAEPAAAQPAAPPVFVQLDPLSVPLPREGKPPLYHFVTLTLQTTELDKPKLVEMMPRLRDAFLRDLNANSVGRNDGSGELDLDLLKRRILKLTEQVMGGPIATDVLIVRTARGAG
jgi:flagellar FliL protein